MRTLLATLGYTPEKITHALGHEAGIGEVVAFCGTSKNRGNANALRSVRQTCAALGLAFEAVELGSAYDFAAAVERFRQEIRARAGRDMLFNLSGGTGVMQAAASFVCFTEGIPFAYYNREERRYVQMASLRLGPVIRISVQQTRILALLRQEEADLAPAEVAKRLRLSASLVDHHLRRLRAQGFVRDVEVEGSRRRRVAATDLARLLGV